MNEEPPMWFHGLWVALFVAMTLFASEWLLRGFVGGIAVAIAFEIFWLGADEDGED
jgi:hypothetical protein